MVKKNKTISLDDDVCEALLNVVNGSKLINELLREHLFVGGNRKKEEVKAKIMEVKNQKLELEKQENSLLHTLSDLETKEKEMKKLFEDIPTELLEDFRDFPKMTEESLKNRWRDIYRGRPSWDKVLEAWKVHHSQS